MCIRLDLTSDDNTKLWPFIDSIFNLIAGASKKNSNFPNSKASAYTKTYYIHIVSNVFFQYCNTLAQHNRKEQELDDLRHRFSLNSATNGMMYNGGGMHQSGGTPPSSVTPVINNSMDQSTVGYDVMSQQMYGTSYNM